ncbi:hypothetical protein C8Q74DRAFT_1199632 [Fomes fomentarius]|nr:hypothetical protein C8Q74DRAFT_1199632 [Fomes fomentarius]
MSNHSSHPTSTSQIEDYAATAVLCNPQVISFRFDFITDFLFSPLGLLTYEYLITFDREVKLFWKRAITGSSILFIVNRYLPLVCTALGIRSSDPTTNKVIASCAALYYMSETLDVLQYLPWALFSTLRAYALLSSGTWRRQWSISTLILLSSLAPLVVNFVSSFVLVTIISRVCLVTSDLLVIFITWKATYKTSREIKVLGQGSSLSSILFRNGECFLSNLV